jgi:excinuclease ABC subunit C
MHDHAEAERFEQAAQLRDRIDAIEAVTQRYRRLKPVLTLPTLKLSEQEEAIIQLQRILSTYTNLPKQYPLKRIEGYDVSNIQGTAAAVGMVVFEDGAPAKQEYRLFNIRSLDTPNDYHMLKEALLRRQNHPEWGEPSLLVIDGGKGQLRGAHYAWQGTTPIISIAKDPDRIIIPKLRRDRANDTQQQLPYDYHVLNLPEDHLALRLIQRIRDESHRFSKRQHTRLRQRQMFE